MTDAGDARHQPRRGIIAIAGVFVAVAALVLVPLAELVRVASEDGASGVRDSLRAPGTPLAIVHTLVIAAVVTVVAVIAGTACAIAVERRSGRWRTGLRLLLASPLIIPEFVLGFAWSQAYGPAGVGDQIGHITIPGLLGPVGIALVLSVHSLPLAYLAMTAGIAARADPDAERAARIGGAGPWTVLRTVTLPLLRLPLLAAGVLVFVSAVGSFAVPQVLGTPAGFATMSTLVYQDLALSAAPEAFRDLTVLALAMALIVLVVVGAADHWLGSLNATVNRPPAGPSGVVASRSRRRGAHRHRRVVRGSGRRRTHGCPCSDRSRPRARPIADTRPLDLGEFHVRVRRPDRGCDCPHHRAGCRRGVVGAGARRVGRHCLATSVARPARNHGHVGLRGARISPRGRRAHRLWAVADRICRHHPARLPGQVLGVRAPAGAGGARPAATGSRPGGPRKRSWSAYRCRAPSSCHRCGSLS